MKNLGGLKHNLNSCAKSAGWMFQISVNITCFVQDSLFSFDLQCFKIIFKNLVFQSIFDRFCHCSYVLGGLYLLLRLFHGKRWKTPNLHTSVGFYYNSVKIYRIKSKFTWLSLNFHDQVKIYIFQSKFLDFGSSLNGYMVTDVGQCRPGWTYGIGRRWPIYGDFFKA